MKFLIPGADNTALGVLVPGSQYNFISASDASSWSITETSRDAPVAAAMTLKEMVVRLATAPGTGDTRVFTVMKNGVATACAVTISETNVTNTVTGLSVSFAAGDTISLRTEATGSPTDTADVYWCILAESVTTHYFVLFGGSSVNLSITANNYLGIQAGTVAVWRTVLGEHNQVLPLAGNLTAFATQLSGTAGTGGDAYNFDVLLDGATTALSIQYLNGETGVKTDTASVAATAGQTLEFQSSILVSPTARNVSWSLAIAPTTPGQSAILFGTSDAAANTATEYDQLLGQGNSSWNGTETTRYATLYTAVLTAIYAKVGTAPGAGKSWTFKVRNEGADLAGATVAIADAATTGNATFSADTISGNRYNWSVTPAGTPTAMTGGAHLGLRINFPLGAARSLTNLQAVKRAAYW